jgi:hypothetical protein
VAHLLLAAAQLHQGLGFHSRPSDLLPQSGQTLKPLVTRRSQIIRLGAPKLRWHHQVHILGRLPKAEADHQVRKRLYRRQYSARRALSHLLVWACPARSLLRYHRRQMTSGSAATPVVRDEGWGGRSARPPKAARRCDPGLGPSRTAASRCLLWSSSSHHRRSTGPARRSLVIHRDQTAPPGLF